MRRVKSGAYGAMIHAAGAGGGRHWGTTAVALDQDRQAQIGSSKAVTQASLSLLGIGQFLEMLRFNVVQALFEALALVAFGEQQAVQRLGLVEALLHQRLLLLGQLTPEAPALELPGQRCGQRHQHET